MINIVKDFRLADMVLIIVLLAFSIGMLFYKHGNREDAMLLVYKKGVYQGEYPITKDRVIRLDEHNTIEIKHGKVRMIEADCPDKRCVKQGASSSLPIICLPNEIVIEIKNRQGRKALIAQ